MLRKLYFVGAVACLLSACASSGAPYTLPTPGGVYSPPLPRENIFLNAPRAPLHSEMFACHGGGGSNVGEIGYRGEAVLYTPYIDTQAGELLRMPVETACLSSGFGWRGTADGGGRQHNGIDLANAEGGWIFAAGEGRVVYADYRGGYGNTIEIDHGRGVHTLYGHMTEFDPNLHPGSHVDAGVAIGRMGMTGNATGVHLHYEVWVDGLLVDPLNYGRPPVYVSQPLPEPVPIEEPAPDKPIY